MEQTKGLSVQIPLELHQKICELKERMGSNTSQCITSLLRTYFAVYYQQSRGGTNMENSRTMAFQISEDLFQRIKDYLARESERQGRKVTQREFVLGLIEDALRQAEQEAAGAASDVPDDILTPAEGQDAEAEMECEDEGSAEGGDEDAAE